MATYDLNLNATVKQNITNLLKHGQPSLINLRSNMFDLSDLVEINPTSAYDYTNSDGKLVSPNARVRVTGIEYYGGSGIKDFYYWRDDIGKFKSYPSLMGTTTTPIKIAFISEVIGKLISDHKDVTPADICKYLGLHPVMANAVNKSISSSYTTFAFSSGYANYSTVDYNNLEVTGGRLLYAMTSSFNVYVGN